MMTEHNICDGRITYSQFSSACDEFLRIAKNIGDPWKTEGDPAVPGDRFLTATYFHRIPNFHLIQCRYDVTYSISHSTPVLYFSMARSCGTSLSLEEIWHLFLTASGSGEKKLDMWDVVSQQDHPALNTPFYCVHPCHNWKLLSECFREKSPTNAEYLISWLSIVGNTFGLNLSNDYARK